MVLIVATDAQPTAALRRLFSRIGFVLLPASVLLIKYYPQLGQGCDDVWSAGVHWSHNQQECPREPRFHYRAGSLMASTQSRPRQEGSPNRARRLLAQCTLLAFGINLLFTAHCATAVACFVLGAGLMLATSLPLIRHRPAAVHALVLAIVLGGGLTALLGGRAAITEALGRKPDLTGRTEIWKILIPMVPNSIGGAGFETFWVGPRVVKDFIALIGGFQMTNESHNGYIEVYLNLGLLGVGLIALILGQGYSRAVSAFRCDPALGGLLVAYVVTAVAYNISEAGFRMLSLEWCFLLLAMVAANRVASLAETVPGPAREPADPSRSDRATRISLDPTGPGSSVETGLQWDAATRRFDRRELRTTRISTSKAENQSRSRSTRSPLTTS